MSLQSLVRSPHSCLFSSLRRAAACPCLHSTNTEHLLCARHSARWWGQRQEGGMQRARHLFPWAEEFIEAEAGRGHARKRIADPGTEKSGV